MYLCKYILRKEGWNRKWEDGKRKLYEIGGEKEKNRGMREYGVG